MGRTVPEHNRYSFVPQIEYQKVYFGEGVLVDKPEMLDEVIKLVRSRFMYDEMYEEFQIDYNRYMLVFAKHNY